jgi:hypothetical protein
MKLRIFTGVLVAGVSLTRRILPPRGKSGNVLLIERFSACLPLDFDELSRSQAEAT